MPIVSANSINIYYELYGPADREVLVLSNGILMSTASWAMQVGVLARHFRVLLYDARGMWQSEHPAGPYSMDQHADDLAALMRVLGIEKAHIAGISYGGEISMAFALRYPEMVRSLIVSSSVSEIDAPMREGVRSWMEAARAKDTDRLYEVTAPLNFSEAWMESHKSLLEAARRRYAALDFAAFECLLDAFNAIDLTPRLHTITAPTLVLVGEGDVLKPRRYSEIIARAIPGAELAVIPHAAHAANWEQPGLWNTLVLGFALKHKEN